MGKADYQSHTIFGLVMNGDATLALMRLKFFDVFEDVSNEDIGLDVGGCKPIEKGVAKPSKVFSLFGD